MVLVELGDKAVLAEDLDIIVFGDTDEVVEFGLDLGVPVSSRFNDGKTFIIIYGHLVKPYNRIIITVLIIRFVFKPYDFS